MLKLWGPAPSHSHNSVSCNHGIYAILWKCMTRFPIQHIFAYVSLLYTNLHWNYPNSPIWTLSNLRLTLLKIYENPFILIWQNQWAEMMKFTCILRLLVHWHTLLAQCWRMLGWKESSFVRLGLLRVKVTRFLFTTFPVIQYILAHIYFAWMTTI